MNEFGREKIQKHQHQQQLSGLTSHEKTIFLFLSPKKNELRQTVFLWLIWFETFGAPQWAKIELSLDQRALPLDDLATESHFITQNGQNSFDQ